MEKTLKENSIKNFKLTDNEYRFLLIMRQYPALFRKFNVYAINSKKFFTEIKKE